MEIRAASCENREANLVQNANRTAAEPRAATAIAAAPERAVRRAAGAGQRHRARTAGPGLGVITGTLPGAASPASPAAVYVTGMRPRGRDARPGQVFTDPLIGQARITSGRSFRITIPDTAAARALIIPGSVINTAIAVVSARGESVWHVPVRVRRGTGPIPATPAGRLPAYSLALLRRAAAANHLSPASYTTRLTGPAPRFPHNMCQAYDIENKYNIRTRASEIHAASGVTASFDYKQQADSTFTIGVSSTDSGWTANGTINIHNSESVNTGFSLNGYANYYVGEAFNYEKDQIKAPPGYICEYPGYDQYPTIWTGTADTGLTAPGRYVNSCQGALEPDQLNASGGHTTKTSGSSVFYSVGVSSPMGFSFGDSTGFSQYLEEAWVNHNSAHSYLCGPGSGGNIGTWPIIYSLNHD